MPQFKVVWGNLGAPLDPTKPDVVERIKEEIFPTETETVDFASQKAIMFYSVKVEAQNGGVIKEFQDGQEYKGSKRVQK